MKRLILSIIFIFSISFIYAQTQVDTKRLIVRDSLKLQSDWFRLTSPANFQVLQRVSGRWKNVDFKVSDIYEVRQSVPNENDVLKFDGTNWIVGTVSDSFRVSSGYIAEIAVVGGGLSPLYDIYQDSILRAKTIKGENAISVSDGSTSLIIRFNPDSVNVMELDTVGLKITASQISTSQPLFYFSVNGDEENINRGDTVFMSTLEPLFVADSAKILHWSDTLAIIATKYDLISALNDYVNKNQIQGVQNYVTKFTDSDTIGISNIFDNGTNIGIGKTNPTDILDVEGTVTHDDAVLPTQSATLGQVQTLISLIEISEGLPPQNISYEQNVTINYENGNDAVIILNGDVLDIEFQNIPDGGSGEILIIQNETGGYGVANIFQVGITTTYAIDSTKELQDLSLSGNTLSLSGDLTTVDISQSTAVLANSAKVSNATHTGEVTGTTGLTISDNVVDEANLKVSNSPSNGYLMQYKDGTDQLTWVQPTLATLGIDDSNYAKLNAANSFSQNQMVSKTLPKIYIKSTDATLRSLDFMDSGNNIRGSIISNVDNSMDISGSSDIEINAGSGNNFKVTATQHFAEGLAAGTQTNLVGFNTSTGELTYQNIFPSTGIVTSNGTSFSSITNNSTNWNTAYTDRLKWDGGATGLVAATGRTSLGGTTVGQSVFTSTNPSAITFLRANADNSVSWLNASDFRTAIGVGGEYTEGNGIDITSSVVKLDVNNMALMSGTSVVDGDFFIVRDESLGTDYKVAAGGLKTYFGAIEYTAGTGLTLAGSTFNHTNSVTASNFGDTGSSRTLAFGGSFVVPYVTYDANGHIVTKANRTLTLPAAPSGSGTVTSVAMTVPTGLTVSGTPITTTGTLAVALQSGYSIPTTANQTTWSTAYTDRLKWDGGATGLSASTGRTSLGGTTIGQNVFTSTNPSATTFLRANTDNTVSWLPASAFRTAIGAGTGSGTVSSVSAGNGMTFTTITTSGAVTLGTPSSISYSSTNSVAANTHSHALSIYGTPTNGNVLSYSSVYGFAWNSPVGGSNTQIQYNNSGAMSGDADLTFDGTNVTVGGYVASDATRVQALTDSIITMNVQSGLKATLTMVGLTTLTITNLQDGQEGLIEVTNFTTPKTLNINGSTGYTTEKLMGDNGEINATANSHTTVVYWRTGATIYYGFIYDN